MRLDRFQASVTALVRGGRSALTFVSSVCDTAVRASTWARVHPDPQDLVTPHGGSWRHPCRGGRACPGRPWPISTARTGERGPPALQVVLLALRWHVPFQV